MKLKSITKLTESDMHYLAGFLDGDGSIMAQIVKGNNYKYGHTIAEDIESPIQLLSSSYQLKSGERPGDGNSAPCGEYTGAYTADFEYVAGLGDLDECNGRQGVTPEFPSGTYYYVITSEYPGIPAFIIAHSATSTK